MRCGSPQRSRTSATRGGRRGRRPREATCRLAATDCIHVDAMRFSSTGTWASSTPFRPRPVFFRGPDDAASPGPLHGAADPGATRRLPHDAATHGGFLDGAAHPARTALRTPRRATAFRTTTRRSLAPFRARRRETLLAIRRSRPRATAPRTPRLVAALFATRLTLRTLRTTLRTLLFATPRLTVFAIVASFLLRVQGG